jgi:hypothetical protein
MPRTWKEWRALIRQRLREGYRFDVSPDGSVRVYYPPKAPKS